MQITLIQDVKNGDFIKDRAFGKKVYVKRGYCRVNKAYEIQDYEDISNCKYLKKNKVVYINFEY